MTRKQKYEEDRKIEAGVAKFLDEHFYAVLKEKVPVIRWDDTEHQYAGIDLTINNTHLDEKVKVRGCLNSVYGYPSFEVSLKNKANYVQDGWFVQPLSTDYYTFIGVYSYTNDECSISDDNNISACDVLWVKKQDVVDMVEEQMTVDQLKSEAKELREDTTKLFKGKSRTTYKHRKFWLTYSAWLDEKPVNLVTLRTTLEKMPHSKHYVVTREKVRKIEGGSK